MFSNHLYFLVETFLENENEYCQLFRGNHKFATEFDFQKLGY